jgi:hypothetical protein
MDSLNATILLNHINNDFSLILKIWTNRFDFKMKISFLRMWIWIFLSKLEASIKIDGIGFHIIVQCANLMFMRIIEVFLHFNKFLTILFKPNLILL